MLQCKPVIPSSPSYSRLADPNFTSWRRPSPVNIRTKQKTTTPADGKDLRYSLSTNLVTSQHDDDSL